MSTITPVEVFKIASKTSWEGCVGNHGLPDETRYFLVLPQGGALDVVVAQAEAAVFGGSEVISASGFDAEASGLAQFQVETLGGIGIASHALAVDVPVFVVLTC